VSGYDDEDVRPARPEPGRADPEHAVGLAQVKAARGAPQVGQLLAQGEVLQCEVSPAAEGGPQRAKEAQEQIDHRTMVHDGGPAWPAPLPIVATVRELRVRMTSWRSTGGRAGNLFVADQRNNTFPSASL
jgi:hypothetical protein